jgi:biopolymer transport protein ExbD
MTELNVTGPMRKKAGVQRMKKTDLKIDMTPMVDLGFLLIAFFIFTTEISKPAVTNLYMPMEGDSTNISQSLSLTILSGSNDEVFYYYGTWEEAVKNKRIYQTSYNEIDGLGKIIRQKQYELQKQKIDKNRLVVLIKPGKRSSYKNMVGVLDEMLINAVTRYVIVDPEKEEAIFLEKHS